ncbi:ATP-dependent RNA helicase DDX54 [Strongyloides ratti]|uniref:RNA helicase n=1 Tax=Strongyloides ratti TaxID=34506 RepID=A0A090MZ20_STRRB|nr:ATP-dependent RNA helicase DDX54 [Strongyloides ratti]CEF68169.1 ATP-dependent RNA helicase DDX54 [Strongyloides ratti]
MLNNKFHSNNNDSDVEIDYDVLNAAANRKNKKSGGWQAMGLDNNVFKALERKGFKQPTPIQRKAIPTILDGRDVVAMSRTGSGKTAAFVVPILQKLKMRNPTGIRALLISPTRELAIQTFNVIKELGRFTGLRAACIVGGESLQENFAIIHQTPDILIATPGRLAHIAVEMELKLDFVKMVVFDEADRLFEMGFADQINEIIRRIPDSRQTLLFSATLPKMIIEFAKAGLSDPCLIRLDTDCKISDKLSMIFLLCRAHEKIHALLYLIREFLDKNQQTVVFCATMKHVEYVVSILEKSSISCAPLYSSLDPTARKENIQKFHDKSINILVVTDVAARGVDIPLLDNVINFHFPPKAKLFVHRVGRVARAGKSGRAYSLIAPDELPYVVDLHLFLGRGCKFAKETDQYNEKDHVIGKIPTKIIHLEMDFIKSCHECLDISDIHFKSENAMKKYISTRPQASAESIKRTKVEMKSVFETTATHPILRNKMDDVKSTVDVLKQLKEYRPKATIFEVRSNNNSKTVEIMKQKRKAHESLIDERKKQDRKRKLEEAKEIGNANKVEPEIEVKPQVIEDDGVFIEAAFEDIPLKVEPVNKKKKDLYLHALPKDYFAEKQMAIDNSFGTLASEVCLDLTADDDENLHKQKRQQVWDRKKKKFVSSGANDDPKNRKIKTEDGHWVKASYKKGVYKDWVNKQKLAFAKDTEDEDRFNVGKNFKKGKKDKEVKGGRSELRSVDQILKSRKAKDKTREFQERRRHEKIKAKESAAKKKFTKKFGDDRGGDRSKKGKNFGGKNFNSKKKSFVKSRPKGRK